MKFQTKHSPLLLLLLPSLAVGLSPRAVAGVKDDDASSLAASRKSDGSLQTGGPGRVVTNKDAPVDGKDGKPHSGPFVSTDGSATGSDGQILPPLKGRPEDPTMIDGKRIPTSNDGVMFDKNRDRPDKGSTGTEGGVSEKEKARKAREGQTGEKALTQPESPKAQPPLPHSEERKLKGGNDEKDSAKKPSKSKQSSDSEEFKTIDYTDLDVSCNPSRLLVSCP